MTGFALWMGAGVVAVVGATVAQAWYLRKVSRALAMLMPLEERVARLTYSVSLLADTTQGCFDAIASQVGGRRDDVVGSRTAVATDAALPDRVAVDRTGETATPARGGTASRPVSVSRQQRQRRVVRAAKLGRTLSEIAAEEALAEGEVALRVHMARDLQTN